VVVVPPWWFPSSFQDYDPQGDLVATGWAAVGLVALVAVLGLAGVVLRRRGDAVVTSAVAVAAVALGAGLLAGARQTDSEVFGLVAGNHRWLWAIGAFVWVVLGTAAARWVAGSTGDRRAPLAVAGVALAGLVVVALLPSSVGEVVRRDERLIPTARALLDSLDEADVPEPVVVERGDLFFGEPYTYVLMAGLQDKGVEWQVAADVDVLRFGERREAARDAVGTVWLANGDEAVAPEAGVERLAFVSTVDAADRRELRDLQGTITLTDEERERRRQLEARWATETIALLYRSRGAEGPGS
jgi:hypothetical protein